MGNKEDYWLPKCWRLRSKAYKSQTTKGRGDPSRILLAKAGGFCLHSGRLSCVLNSWKMRLSSTCAMRAPAIDCKLIYIYINCIKQAQPLSASDLLPLPECFHSFKLHKPHKTGLMIEQLATWRQGCMGGCPGQQHDPVHQTRGTYPTSPHDDS